VRKRSRGQSLVEFALLSPILVLLTAGILDLGRAYYYEVASIDAARDAARYGIGLAANPAQQPGPGYQSICDHATADLSNVTLFGSSLGSVSCAQATTLPATTRPYYPSGTYSVAPNHALVVIYCPDGPGGCVGNRDSTSNANLAVTVYYGFSLLTPGMNSFIGGGALTFQNAAVMTSLW
jgi:Flp pilus assembly protein TadG